LKVFHVDLVGRLERAANSSVVERVIYPAKLLDCLVDTVVDSLFVGDIEFDLFDGDVGVVFLELGDGLGDWVAVK
jgi:hypothetical protein